MSSSPRYISFYRRGTSSSPRSISCYRRLYWRHAPRGPRPSSDLIGDLVGGIVHLGMPSWDLVDAFVGPRRAPRERGIAHLNAHNCLHMGRIKGHAHLQMGRIAEYFPWV